jgi:D-glycerate 3-kinase
MQFHIDKDIEIFKPIFEKRPEVTRENLKKDLTRYYLPYIQKLIDLKKKKGGNDGLIVGVSAIQGAGKTTQGEILEILLKHLGFTSISLSIDDHYFSHQQLNELREFDPRYIRRGVTHDIYLAIENLTALKNMSHHGQIVKIPIYDKGANKGDGDWVGWKEVKVKPNFIFYDGWMLGARRVEDESVFESGLPALDTKEHIEFAKEVNRKLDEYIPLWDLFDFMNVLYVPNYEMSLKWRDQAEEALRKQGKGMTSDQIREFVYYFWRSVHPAIHIKNLAYDSKHTNQVVIIGDDHLVKEVLSPKEVKEKYP